MTHGPNRARTSSSALASATEEDAAAKKKVENKDLSNENLALKQQLELEIYPTMNHPILSSILDSYFVNLVKRLEADIKEQILEVFSHSKIKVAVVPAELELKLGGSDGQYIKWLEAFLEKQCSEIWDKTSDLGSNFFCVSLSTNGARAQDNFYMN
ncbi:hypothetical protein VNO78_27049 [Psophocarpus tetragonolobus]|uniref:Uncharacterized protein n=1 Tax=Psophocarpus tetragonolobus TaxID=3891 RepID=A0AAN9XBL1_PSOTE